MKTTTTLTLVAAGLLLAGTAAVGARGFGPGGPGGFAGPGGFGGPGYNLFQTADANKDGVITREEALAARAKLFGSFDTDNSGTVNTEELDAGLTPKFNTMKTRARYRLLSRFDANGDGQISKEEFDKNALWRFDRADVNNDGKITRDEVMNSRMMNRRGMAMGRKRGGRMGCAGGPGMRRGGWNGGPGMMQGRRGGPGMWRPGPGFPGGNQAGPGMMPPWGGMPPSGK